MNTAGLFPDPAGSEWPLLQVMLCDDEQAQQAWREWSSRYTLDDLHTGGLRLLIMALPRLLQLGEDIPDLPRLKGLRRRTYSSNQRTWHGVMQLAALFADEGLEVMVTKGLALSRHCYEPGQRYAIDADVVVRWADYRKAQTLLESDARFARAEPELVADPNFNNGEEWRLGPLRIDLHARICHEFTFDEAVEKALWSRALPDEGGVVTPAPEDSLILAALSVTRIDRQYYGLVDIVRLLERAGADFRWPLLCETAIENAVALRVYCVLDYLSKHFAVAVPAEVLAELQDQQAEFEALELKSILDPGVWPGLDRYVRRWLRHGGKPWNLFSLLTFPAFLYKSRGRPGPVDALRQLYAALHKLIRERAL
ncbi:MAG: nucleotidyltransferase family protein [Pseudomonadota bacterium]